MALSCQVTFLSFQDFLFYSLPRCDDEKQVNVSSQVQTLSVVVLLCPTPKLRVLSQSLADGEFPWFTVSCRVGLR